MSHPKSFRMPVGGQTLALMHLMAEKGLIQAVEDRNLDQSKGEVLISAVPSDKNAVLFFNPGPAGRFEESFSYAMTEAVSVESVYSDIDSDEGASEEEESTTNTTSPPPDGDGDSDQGN